MEVVQTPPQIQPLQKLSQFSGLYVLKLYISYWLLVLWSIFPLFYLPSLYTKWLDFLKVTFIEQELIEHSKFFRIYFPVKYYVHCILNIQEFLNLSLPTSNRLPKSLGSCFFCFSFLLRHVNVWKLKPLLWHKYVTNIHALYTAIYYTFTYHMCYAIYIMYITVFISKKIIVWKQISVLMGKAIWTLIKVTIKLKY